MPEYLAPGVRVEEVSFRAKSIEGVATSTTGMAGMARFGPVRHPGGPRDNGPRLVTSYVEFERIYGKLERLAGDRLPYLAHAARAFFLNGGSRLYVSRVYTPPAAGTGVAEAAVPVVTTPASTARWVARWPGSMGEVLVRVGVVRSKNIAVPSGAAAPAAAVRADRARAGSIVQVVNAGGAVPGPGTALVADELRVVRIGPDGSQTFVRRDGTADPLAADDQLLLVELDVEVRVDAERADRAAGVGCDPEHRRYVGRILGRDDPQDDTSTVWLDYAFPPDPRGTAIDLMVALAGGGDRRLDGGDDGQVPDPAVLLGEETNVDDATETATGLEALAEIEDIAIVATPDAAAYLDEDTAFLAASNLVRHAEQCRYRIAVVDGPEGASMTRIREFRGKLDSSYAALYHPWIETLDPTESPEQGAPPAKLLLPPSGSVAGIYARNDVTRGVHKAPANEVVFGLTRFETTINTGRQEVLNPEGINALRFFSGRGNRVWGARTLSSDPEWRYVNVRRFFIFLEHSIDKSTQWAVFEPNNEDLWRKMTRTVKDFLEVQWRTGALIGATPEQAFFVRCDRTTMTQNDLDNGRLICLIGVAPSRPAEFVIFRIGQWTADARS